jgi:hypothetical protein
VPLLLTVFVAVAFQAPQEKPKLVEKKLTTGLKLQLPEAWKEGKTNSQMRLAQFALKDKQEKAGDAELVVFHFGAGGAGGVDANIDRWVGQFEGKKRADAKIEKLEGGALEGTLVDLTGTYVAPVRPGSQERLNQPDTRMVAAILKTQGGEHYLKLVGPKDTVADWVDDFRAAVKSAQAGP